MKKLKSSIDQNLRRRKVIKIAGKGKVELISAPWVDTELIDNIKIRSYPGPVLGVAGPHSEYFGGGPQT